MNAIISTRTVISRAIQRIGSSDSYQTVQKARFPPQRSVSQVRVQQSRGILYNFTQQRRRLATGSGARGDKVPVSPHITFYTIYGRPIAKVFLIAMGMYQLLYFCWKKLEAVEEQKGKQGWI
ncbi:hypothetical protein L211DRAFT_832734 [Terfezia boudieri ATCC MYA-4762]|uniref:Uncharacterized protein n=1 Tax=Terfezia boudieri ATCC MYA-4762 TaxID=1051890 RepID=A0A3N4M1E5_9PEZI|nr:hypothetical protein L211DRAFT_832734 [Terfezia boudieri ATCC MYA-4762]